MLTKRIFVTRMWRMINPAQIPSAASRCSAAADVCRQVAPALEAKAAGHVVACHFAPKEGAIAA